MNEVLKFDRLHLWHPYAPAGEAAPPVWEVVKAEGLKLTLADGRELIDGVSSWWCACHGHNPPEIVEAIREQSARFSQVMFAGFTHRPAAELGELLLSFAPKNMDQVFYVDSGSVATEAMMKLAMLYQEARRRPERKRMLTIRGGYHGDTLGAMSVSDPGGMHRAFNGTLNCNIFAAAPVSRHGEAFDEGDMTDFEEKLRRNGKTIAGVILEPVFQGANRMYFYHEKFLRRARELCDEFDILLMFDEVATGFGRLGKFFASEFAGVEPDVMSVGKGLTGGMIGLAAVLASRKTAETAGSFTHGPTFMANPVACAAGAASLRMFRRGAWRENVGKIEKQLARELAPAAALPNVSDVRSMGAVGVIEVKKLPPPEAYREILLKHGVWLRPFGKYVYTMPPLTTGSDELSKITSCMLEIAGI